MAQTIQWCCGFDSKDASIDGITLTGSGATYNTTGPRNGTDSLRINAASGAASYFTITPSFATPRWLGVWVKVASRPSSTARVIYGTAAEGLRLNANGTIGLYQGSTLRATSTIALTDTSKYYLIRTKFASSVSIGDTLAKISEFSTDGNLMSTDNLNAATATAFNSGMIWGANDTVADTYDARFDDAVVDEGDWSPEDVKVVLAVGQQDTSVGTGWQQPGGDTTDIWVAVVNTPPNGIADSTSSGDANKMIRNASSNSAAYRMTILITNFANITIDTKIYAWQMVIATAAPVATQAKTGSLELLNSGTQPVLAAASFGNFHSGTNQGTYPTGWKITRSATIKNTKTDGSQLYMEVKITGGTSTRIASVCFMGMYIALAPPKTAAPGLGQADLTGFAPTIKIDKPVATGLGQLTLTGFAPTITVGGSRIVIPDAGQLDLTGFAPQAKINNFVRPDVGALTLSGFAPTPKLNTIVRPDVGALTLSGFSPTIKFNTIIRPALGQLTLTGFAPNVVLSTVVKPALGQLTLTGFSPSIVFGTVIRPDVGTLTLTGFSPTVVLGTVIKPGVGALTLTGFSPTVLTPKLVLPGTGILTLTGFAPNAIVNTYIKPGLGQLTLTGFAPTLTEAFAILPGTGQLILDGFAPTIRRDIFARPDVGSLTLNGFAPIASINRNVNPGVGQLTLTGFAPAVRINKFFRPDVGQLILTGFAPTVSVNRILTPGKGDLTLTGFAPILINPKSVKPGTGTLTLAGFAPTVTIGSFEDVTISFGGQVYPSDGYY